MEQFDAIVVGGGPGGYVCAIRLSQNGMKTALVEERDLGGTCLNRGCIPAKTLLQSSHLYHQSKDCAQFGVNVEGVTFDYPKIKARKDAISKQLSNGIAGLLKSHGVKVFNSRAVLTDKSTLSLSDGSALSAKHIVLATGSRPARIPIEGIDLPGVMDSDALLDLTDCPKEIVVVGGGVIGTEFATHFSNLGVKVTILEMLDTILAPLDKEISSSVHAKMAKQGIDIRTEVRVTKITEGPVIHYVGKDGAESNLTADIVLMAGGRSPNTAEIGLESVGVAKGKRGHIEVDGLCRTNIPNIYAIGDITGKLELAHMASAQGLVVAAHIAGKPCKEVDIKKVPSCVYTSPEVAMVGLTEAQARESGRNIGTGKFSLTGNGKAMVMGENEGTVKLVFDKDTDEILGAHLLSPRATDMISGIAALMNAEGTLVELGDTVHPHPTVSEVLMEAAHAAHNTCVHAPKKRG